jgi:SAM-dependent methyltransferase
VNPFTDASSAERYARGRPYFHPIVIERIRQHLGTASLPQLTLDAGCGTGLSSRALLEISERIIAVDRSLGMLAHVPRHSRIFTVAAACEQIPMSSKSVDLVTAGCVIHWLALDLFTSEARRILRPGGVLVVYDNFFVTDQPEISGFQTWFQRDYVGRYPSPRRNNIRMDDPAAWPSYDFELIHYERYENYETYSLDRFVDYLVTQSNIISAVEHGHESIDSVRAWLNMTLAPFFAGTLERRFLYSGPIAVLRPTA